MTYDEAKDAVYTTRVVSDGYFGKIATVGVCFDPESGRTLCVADSGYFNSGLPQAVDQAESEWLLEHHPSGRHISLPEEMASEKIHSV